MLRVGVISDTHGLLRPQAVAALRASDLLLHAGDVGDPAILGGLTELAPLHAVRGNVDRGSWAESLPWSLSLDLEGVRLFMHHGHRPLWPEQAGKATVIVQGHSHRPEVRSAQGVLHLNPGSAGRRRFRLPVTVARLLLDGGEARAELVPLLD